MFTLLKRHWHWLVLAITLTILFLLNFRPGAVIFGLDNASPYWRPLDIWRYRTSGETVFLYSGLYFMTPILAFLKLFGLGASALSHLYVWGMLLAGLVGTAKLAKQLSSKNGQIAWIVAAIVLLSSLFTTWIINQPNILFLAAYGTIPWLVHYLSKKGLFWCDWLIIAGLSWLFLITSQNLVALAAYVVQIVVLSLLMKGIRSRYDRHSRWLVSGVKALIMWGLGLIFAWAMVLQIALWVGHDHTWLPQAFNQYVQALNNNEGIKTVSNDLRLAEQYNTLTNSARFANGWMELHYPDGQPVFAQYDLYRNNLGWAVLGLIPTFTIIWLSIPVFTASHKRLRNITPLLIIGLIGLLLTSRFVTVATDPIPYLHDALRWTSSKFWPLFIIPWAILSSLAVAQLSEQGRAMQKRLKPAIIIVFVGLLMLYAWPVWHGQWFSRAVYNAPPTDYTQLSEVLPAGSRVLYLPPPQQLYFRAYSWGYYGSDWTSYLTPATIVDKANLFQFGTEYDALIEQYNACQAPLVNIDYIVLDHSVSPNPNDFPSNKLLSCLENDYSLIKETELLSIYKRIQ